MKYETALLVIIVPSVFLGLNGDSSSWHRPSTSYT